MFFVESKVDSKMSGQTKQEVLFVINDIKEEPSREFVSLPDFPADLDLLSFESLEPEIVMKEELDLIEDVEPLEKMSGVEYNYNYFEDSINDKNFEENSKDLEDLPSYDSSESDSESKLEFNIIEEISINSKNKKHLKPSKSSSELRPTYECEFCKKSFLHERSLLHHLSLKHPKDGSSPPKPLKKPHVCPICNVVRSHSRKNIQRHIESVHEKKKGYHCAICNLSFGWERSLRNHNEHFHAKVGQPDDRNLDCEECPSIFETPQSLSHHKKMHHNISPKSINKPFECTFCNTQFTTIVNLQKHHQQKHSDIPESELLIFKCQHCEMSFPTADLMMVHMVDIHEHEKKFNCEMK